MASRSAIKDKIYISQASIQPNAIHFFHVLSMAMIMAQGITQIG